MASATRIRWTRDEWEAIFTRCEALRVEYPAMSLRQAIHAATLGLPENRRRPVHPGLQLSVSRELKKRTSRAGALPPIKEPQETSGLANTTTMESGTPITQSNAPLLDSTIAVAVELVVQILRDPAVKRALMGLISGSRMVTGTTPATATDVGSTRSGKERGELMVIFVAGTTSEESRSLRSAYRGILSLQFWSTQLSLKETQAAAASADVVIGFNGTISSALESSLRGTAKHYVSHRGGVPSLRVRLAELATSSAI